MIRLFKTVFAVDSAKFQPIGHAVRKHLETSVPATKTPSEKLVFIDGLRGLAILMVIACHVAYIPVPALEAAPQVLRLAYSGRAGVILFFIVSSFTLCHSFDIRRSSFNLSQTRDFYLRRLFRILPLYLISIPIAWLRDLSAFNYARPMSDLLTKSLSIFIPNDYQGIVWGSWTLGVELFFYLLFPLIFRICNTLRRALLGLLISITSDLAISSTISAQIHRLAASGSRNYTEQMISSLDTEIRFSLLHNLQFFMIGIVFFHLYREYKQNSVITRNLGRALRIIGFFLFLLLVFFYPNIIERTLNGNNLLLGFALFVIVLGSSIHKSSFIGSPLLAFLGTISYSLYLLHPPLIALMHGVYLYIYTLPFSSSFSYAICLLSTLCILVPLSIISFNYVEKPGINLGKSWIKALSSST